MNYHRKNKKKINKKIILLIIVLASLFFFGTNIKSFFQIISLPVLKFKNTIVAPFDNSSQFFKVKENLIEENEKLKKENRNLKIENLTVRSLQQENQSLKKLIDYVQIEDNFVVGQVLNKPPYSPYDTFLIDLGSNQVNVGDFVYYLNVPIGKIEEVYQKTSVVRLFSSADERIFVTISDQQAEAIGIGGGGFVITLPKDLEISEGESIFADDLVIGSVDEIKIDETGAFKNIYFRYPFNFNKVDFIEILNRQQ